MATDHSQGIDMTRSSTGRRCGYRGPLLPEQMTHLHSRRNFVVCLMGIKWLKAGVSPTPGAAQDPPWDALYPCAAHDHSRG